MAYTALYRKFRPGGFDAVRGQDHIVTTLKNQIKASRIGHAYLFCGTRGTGKTSIAKILAKAVNCEAPVDGSPCNVCETCKAIGLQQSMNVIEIDAASNNGVDNIREIIEEVQYSPTEGKYKVYIIDEVHMLSAGAFNALLKTLEEPPSYVIFILATTEVHKIPITIMSRCQRYDFRRITVDTITERLKELMETEGIDAEEKALRYIAKMGDGSMRDALSLLDQCIAFYLGQRLTYDNALYVLGAVDTEVFSRLLRNIVSGDVAGCIQLLEELMVKGRDLLQFVVDFIWYFRNLLLLKTSEDSSDKIDMSSDNLELLIKDGQLLDAETIMRYIRIFSELSGQIKYSSQKRVLIEISLIKLCRPEMERNYDSVVHRLSLLEKRMQTGILPEEPMRSSTIMKPQKVDEKPKTELINAVPEDLKEIAANWRTILSEVSPLTAAILSSAKPTAGGDNTLLLVFDKELDRDFMNQEKHLEEIQDIIAKKVNKKVSIRTELLKKGSEEMNSVIDLSKIIKTKIEYED